PAVQERGHAAQLVVEVLVQLAIDELPVQLPGRPGEAAVERHRHHEDELPGHRVPSRQAAGGTVNPAPNLVAALPRQSWPVPPVPRGRPMSAPDRRRVRSPRALALMLGVAAVVLAADIISKTLVLRTLPGRPPVRLLDGLITLRLTFNAGA